MLAGLSACDGPVLTHIGDIAANPQRYAGVEVQVYGTVATIRKVPFLVTKIYSIRDDSGEIWVRTDAEAPTIGTSVQVRGVVKLAKIPRTDIDVTYYLREGDSEDQ
jgi:hypothetical protein